MEFLSELNFFDVSAFREGFKGLQSAVHLVLGFLEKFVENGKQKAVLLGVQVEFPQHVYLSFVGYFLDLLGEELNEIAFSPVIGFRLFFLFISLLVPSTEIQ